MRGPPPAARPAQSDTRRSPARLAWTPPTKLPGLENLYASSAIGPTIAPEGVGTTKVFTTAITAQAERLFAFALAQFGLVQAQAQARRAVRAGTGPSTLDRLREWRGKTNAMAAFGAVTLAYWAFMLTDGALRMLVLLHFHTLGFSAVQLAFMFLLYEIMGIVTNLSAGWLAARFGLTATLYTGLVLQIVALVALSALDPTWTLWFSVLFVMLVQGLAGVAKDFTKMSSKSAVKLLAPKDQSGALFKWVAALTGSKNAIKGLGFLLGAALLALFGFTGSVLMMAAGLGAVLLAVGLFMPRGLPIGRKDAKFSEVFSKNKNINALSAARVFLFGARDAWFVVGIPAYFYTVLSTGTAASMQAAFFAIGTFMALWLVGYGLIQALAPKLLKAKDKPLRDVVHMAQRWAAILALVPAGLTLAAVLAGGPALWLTLTLVLGLLLFGAVFAVNSSLHSYLILAFTKDERAAMDVGFYYMANATGRLIGTLLSGLAYFLGGLPTVLAASTGMAALNWIFARRLSDTFTEEETDLPTPVAPVEQPVKGAGEAEPIRIRRSPPRRQRRIHGAMATG